MSEKTRILHYNTDRRSRNQDVQDTAIKITPRSSKYKNQHRKREQQTSLLDFVIKPRPKTQRQTKAHKLEKTRLTITRASYIVYKPKGKTRLDPKKKITRLKRSVRVYRTSKKAEREVAENDLEGVPVVGLDINPTAIPLEQQVQNLSLSKTPALNDLSQAKTVHAIHSRRFRSYCDNCTRPRLKELTSQLLRDLHRFQKRAFAKNEIKARAHPRLVLGVREALARLRINKVKLLLLATDCEICPGESGLDATIEGLKFQCQQQKVPYCFPLLRRELSYALQKRAQISCVAILDFDGANATYADLLNEIEDARAEYKRRTAS
ncbi:selenocysteine insertion sequence-binding protein 2 [Drosophila simulans]|uniref:GD14076 n=1 Tax=Drosophila simulans TaxID=7240 RepID=B4QLL9_DROSI|nr:selenocysteine insertion sequence-binding protein 2 [Drosophila simulans]XP_044778897.1 selenocysteine insertion sequence-binding protein 2 [Drosophila simulans]EDX09679.1 GD14076 [Drosophila simulans]KMY98343.1 uncharacterized protein Dsimw501_GD14076 [Drosophila simulans]